MKRKSMQIRVGVGKRARKIIGLFDTGSDDGLMRRSVAQRLTTVALPDPIEVVGIGGASALARRSALFQVRVLGKWCRYSALVVPDKALDVDLLIGEDFLSRYGLQVAPRRNRVVVAYPEHFKSMTRRRLFIASPRGRK